MWRRREEWGSGCGERWWWSVGERVGVHLLVVVVRSFIRSFVRGGIVSV